MSHVPAKSPVNAPADVIVIGAGLAGLACAHTLKRAGRRVLCLEATDQPGGVVRSLRQQGYLFEAGPNTVQSSARHFRELAQQVGLADRLQVSDPAANTRYLWYEGELVALPHSPKGLFSTPLLSRSAKMRAMSEPFRRLRGDRTREPEPSFEEFLTERIGREATRTLAGAFVRGVYATEIEDLGARSAFPRMWSLAYDNGGLIRGMLAKKRAAKANPEAPAPGPVTKRSDLLTFPDGLAELPRAIAKSLGDSLRLECPVAEIERGAGTWKVQLESDEILEAPGLVLALPAKPAHQLLAMAVPERVELGGLYEIDHAAVTVVHLGLKGADLPPGFGFLMPPDQEGKPGAPGVLGTLFPSRIFAGRAPAGGSTVTTMLRGADVRGLDDEALIARAHAELVTAIGGDPAGQIACGLVQRWDQAIARYQVGHAGRMESLRLSLRRAMPSLELAGSYLAGVSVDDTIRSGIDAAQAWMAQGLQGGAA